jgi:hypothetical protein
MLAASFSAFAPSTMPEAAAANANLFVSAENSQFQNYFGGPMVIEVVVIDSDIKDTDKGKGEPDVTINGNKLRMVQATDGNWYGYFADRDQALKADAIQGAGGSRTATGLDFGTFCSSSTNWATVSFSQTVGVAFPFNATGGQPEFLSTGRISGGAITNNCDGPLSGSIGSNGTALNVVREEKSVNLGTVSSTGVKVGQIGLNTTQVDDSVNLARRTGVIAGIWPFIQLYTFTTGGNVVVQYNKGGGVQSTTLKFDTVDQFAQTSLDRSVYPQSAQVHLTVTDLQLNIDPTDEDSWTFGTTKTSTTSNFTTYYGIFNEDGALVSSNGISKALTGNLTSLMFEDNGVMKVNVAKDGSTILALQDNGDTVLSSTGAINAGSQTITNQPVTVTETAPNTGVFGTYDESDVSVLITTSSAPRGKSATLEYNTKTNSIVVGFGFASVDIKAGDAEWNSGEEIPVTVTDSDANKNSRADEDLDLNNPNVSLIPSLRIGTPFTLGANGTGSAGTIRAVTFSNFFTNGAATGSSAMFSNSTFTTNAARQLVPSVTVDKFSDRAILSGAVSTVNLRGAALTYGQSADDLKRVVMSTNSSAGDARLHGFNLFNYDIRGLSQNSTVPIPAGSVNASLAYATTAATTDSPLFSTAAAAKSFRVISLVNNTNAQGIVSLNSTAIIREIDQIGNNNPVGVVFTFRAINDTSGNSKPIVADFFSFGYKKDGITKNDRVNNMIVRIQAEETGDNTSVFEGSLEYVMLNQLNILVAETYTSLRTVADDPVFIVHQDLDDEEAPRVNYNDLAGDGTVTQVSDQEDAPTHSGVVSFDKPTYKKADTVLVTLEDQDLNTDVDLIDIYTTVNKTAGGANDVALDAVGSRGLPTLSNGDALGRLLDITFDDARWKDLNNACTDDTTSGNTVLSLQEQAIDQGLFASGFTLIETGSATGIFTGDFVVPAQVCNDASGARSTPRNTQGLDMEVNYVDFRDASGQIVEVGDGAGIRANTGSVSLDRTVYPVPFGSLDDFTGITVTDNTSPSRRSIFPIHLTGIGNTPAVPSTDTANIEAAETLGDGILTIHVQVNDPDFDTSASGEDKIAENVTGTNRGPVKVTVSRGQSSIILGYAGSTIVKNGLIDVGADNTGTGVSSVRQLGPITETSPSSGIFEFDLDIEYVDGPADAKCPQTGTSSFDSLLTPGTKGAVGTRFDAGAPASGTNYCILQGDIITVEYTDPADASGDINTVTDSATFDLRNGALQSDKSVYIIGSDMILTLIEPDLDLDNDLAETYDLDLIEWDSDAATVTMGDQGGSTNQARFDPEPSDLRETGDSTGIFQSVIEIPDTLNNDKLERGEEIVLEYTDWGPSGADFVGQEDEDINLTVFTSNFGATVELDQKVYTWTDKVYITVVAPDQNFDSNLVDDIGNTNSDPLKVSTRGNSINRYKLVETGTDTGIFTGEVILTGFAHNADGKPTGDANGNDAPTVSATLRNTGSGPTDGFLTADDDDGITVSYEFSEDETVVGSALIRWNIGEVAWLEASYPASGTGVVRVIDPDMNLRPEAIDNFDVNVWSDSDAGGIDLTVTETNEATGIFEGTVFFTTTDDSSGHRLRVAEGDTVTAEYEDNTLPDPYTTADELDITGTAFIGTVVPPLERAPASNARVVDAFGNTLDEVSVDQQVQIAADLTNGQDREQPFAYLVQIQDENGVTVSLAWITGSLSAGQSFSPALSWIATAPGTYTATVFVWESVDNPTALSPPVSVDITVS